MDGFVQVPNALFTYYNYFPQYNGSTTQVYAYLKRMTNDNYGYAFPTEMQAMEDLVMTDSSFRKHVKTLQNCGLLDVQRRRGQRFSNNIYYVKEPLTDLRIFLETFPEANAVYVAKMATVEKLRKRKESDAAAYDVAQSGADKADLEWL